MGRRDLTEPSSWLSPASSSSPPLQLHPSQRERLLVRCPRCSLDLAPTSPPPRDSFPPPPASKLSLLLHPSMKKDHLFSCSLSLAALHPRRIHSAGSWWGEVAEGGGVWIWAGRISNPGSSFSLSSARTDPWRWIDSSVALPLQVAAAPARLGSGGIRDDEGGWDA